MSKTKFCYKPRSKKLRYSMLRELVFEYFKGIVPDISKIGSIVLEACAAANAELPVRLFKRNGCWLSNSAKEGYVQDSLSLRLSVSRAWEV